MSNDTTIPMKRCTKCGEEFPATTEYFHKEKLGKYGLRADCKWCKNAKKRAARLDPIKGDEIRRYMREYWQIPENKAKKKAYDQSRYHRPEVKARAAQNAHKWRQRPGVKEHLKEYFSEWKQRVDFGPLNVVYGAKRKARKRGLCDDFTPAQRQFAIEYFNNCCAVCGRQFFDLFGERQLALDHWIPITSKECPGTTASNMVPLCHGTGGCNNSKRNTDPQEWLIRRFGKRKSSQILERINSYFDVVRKRAA